MQEKTGMREIGRFFVEKYEKLVRYFQGHYADLSDMEAEDIVSDAMADLFEKVDVLEGVENISAYIFRSIRNRANDYLRRRKKSVPIDEPGPGDTGHAPATIDELRYTMTAEVESSEIRDRLVQALASLEPGQAAVWIATEIDGYTFRELAEAWGVPIGTLLARKHRANAALQKKLEDFKPR